MVEAPFATYEDIAAHLKTLFGDAASITEQTDAWVRLDVSAPNLHPLFERLCNVDLSNCSDRFCFAHGDRAFGLLSHQAQQE